MRYQRSIQSRKVVLPEQQAQCNHKQQHQRCYVHKIQNYVLLFVSLVCIQIMIQYLINPTVTIVQIGHTDDEHFHSRTSASSISSTSDILFITTIQQQEGQAPTTTNTASQVQQVPQALFPFINNNSDSSTKIDAIPFKQQYEKSNHELEEEKYHDDIDNVQYSTVEEIDDQRSAASTTTRTRYGATVLHPERNITIDIISIGTIARADYQMAQERTFGSHPAVRNFYRITEYNDTIEGPDCSTSLTQHKLDTIIHFCSTQWDTDKATIRTWLRKRLKPYRYDGATVASVCAQKRPIDALYQILHQITSNLVQQNNTGSSDENIFQLHQEAVLEDILPDFIVLITDETYLNMDPFLKGLLEVEQSSTSSMHILGGCVYNFPSGLQFRHPHSGFGTILSKDVLLRLLRPIYCTNDAPTTTTTSTTILQQQQQEDGFTKLACWRLYEQNHFHELQYFTEGMSVLDLMYNYTKSLSFLNVEEWEDGDGFCFHSDQALGYFLGFYHIAIPDDEIQYIGQISDNIRMQSQHGYSEIGINGAIVVDDNNDGTSSMSQCQNTYYEQCHQKDMICLYIEPNEMERIYFENTFYDDEIGKKLLQRARTTVNETFQMDVISIGTLSKPQLQIAQERSFGSHRSIRHWFRITELNDTDSSCYTNLTFDQVNTLHRKCSTVADDQSYVSERISKRLFNPRNHTGWICAQKRPIDGLYFAVQHYLKNQSESSISENNNNETYPSSLPDYLAIIDDDTYLNVKYIMKTLPAIYPSQEPYAITGCRFVWPKRLGFAFSYGGFGTILTRRAIENLIRPLYCKNITDKSDGFNQMACWRLQQNSIGENIYFSDGMSVLDLMYVYSSKQLYTHVDEWDDKYGFCLHSDHALAYFIGFYHIVVPDVAWSSVNFNKPNIPQSRIKKLKHPYYNDNLRRQYSYIGIGKDGVGDSCKFIRRRCTVESPICHYVNENQMMRLYSRQMQMQ